MNRGFDAFAVRADLPPTGSGTLSGLTLAVKDNIDVAGLPSGGGSRLPVESAPVVDAMCVARLRAAGMRIVGKTRMSELAFGGWGTNAATGTPRNPWDGEVHRVTGGSSSGSGAAVAGGLVDAALGTDTGGSVRIPASLCGLTGIRPPKGVIPDTGLHRLAPSLDVVGPMAWDIVTAARMLDVMSGRVFDAEAALRDDRPLRVAACTALGLLDPDVAAAFANAVAALAVTESVAPPRPFEAYVDTLGAIAGFEAYRLHGARLAEADKMDPGVVARLRAGSEVGEAAYRAALTDRHVAIGELRTAWGSFDLVLTPATPIAAVPVTEVEEDRLPLSRFTRIGSLLDLPCVAVPCGLTRDGLPIGLQIISTGRDVSPAIALASRWQQATGWHRARPKLFAGRISEPAA